MKRNNHKLLKVLYLGLDPTHFQRDAKVTHYPVIAIRPRPLESPKIQKAFSHMKMFTHVIFTSKSTVKILADANLLSGKTVIAIGEITAKYLRERKIMPLVAKEATQEGIISLLKEQDLQEAYLFWPRSSIARNCLIDYFIERSIRYMACDFYDTEYICPQPLPRLKDFDEIVFTSPSTVRSFFQIFSEIPKKIRVHAIGPVTKTILEQLYLIQVFE